MRLTDRAKYNAIYYLLLSVVIRWGYNIFFVLYHGLSPMENAILHMFFALIATVLAWMSIQLYRKSAPSGSNLGCGFLAILIINFITSIGAVFAAMIHLFAANGGQIENIWLM